MCKTCAKPTKLALAKTKVIDKGVAEVILACFLWPENKILGRCRCVVLSIYAHISSNQVNFINLLFMIEKKEFYFCKDKNSEE